SQRALASSCVVVLKYSIQFQAQKLIEDTASLHLGESGSQLSGAGGLNVNEYGVGKRFMSVFDSRFYCCSSSRSLILAILSIIEKYTDRVMLTLMMWDDGFACSSDQTPPLPKSSACVQVRFISILMPSIH
ncbi:hypothetical protein ZWY2020_020068, partial [Hordeum vulgare]